MFENISFMKPPVPLEQHYTGSNYAPMFRKKFFLEDTRNAVLSVCGLGFGYYWINGQQVSEDLLTAPVSNYSKTLWYNVYDVSHLLKKGENILAVWCGNGWYNEDFPSAWDYDRAPWRDVPKCILKLTVGGVVQVISDSSWKCQQDSTIWFNALRSGEYFDARKYDAAWVAADYDDGTWAQAVADETPPKGIFRECQCEPVREGAVYAPKAVIQTGKDTYVFDFGQNMSGYVRLRIAGRPGQALVIRYAEQLREDGALEINTMDKMYPVSPFMTDRFICSGREMTWSPRFAYHGFRYIEIQGLSSPDEAAVEGVFIHQAIENRTEFTCSDEFLNKLFRAGQFSTLSNLVYQVTDCPTREKLGWCNDAQASMEQILTNFKAEHLLEKWLQDIRDAMREDGALPGIIPTAGWGYHWGNGPVSDGVLFELPHRIYLHTGNPAPLLESRPWFDRYLAYLDTRREADGFVRFGLPDWARPGFDCDHPELESAIVPTALINGVLEYRFCQIAALAARLAKAPEEAYLERAEALRKHIMETFLASNGTCTVDHQTAAALMIYYRMYDRLEPLKQQLKRLVEEKDFHHICGMVGLRRLLEALNHCGLQEYSYRVLTVGGYPGYRAWLEQDATTLWEYWDYDRKADSKNHHMYSDFMSWMVKTVLGIRQEADSTGFRAVSLEPYFFEGLTYARGSCDTCGGRLGVAWERHADGIHLHVEVPENMTVTFRGELLPQGISDRIV